LPAACRAAGFAALPREHSSGLGFAGTGPGNRSGQHCRVADGQSHSAKCCQRRGVGQRVGRTQRAGRKHEGDCGATGGSGWGGNSQKTRSEAVSTERHPLPRRLERQFHPVEKPTCKAHGFGKSDEVLHQIAGRSDKPQRATAGRSDVQTISLDSENGLAGWAQRLVQPFTAVLWDGHSTIPCGPSLGPTRGLSYRSASLCKTPPEMPEACWACVLSQGAFGSDGDLLACSVPP